ncbi:hypothetical protein [Microcystis aeruginosa]|nr:hypothetical protein [Microcystis aeruginosa]
MLHSPTPPLPHFPTSPHPTPHFPHPTPHTPHPTPHTPHSTSYARGLTI